MIHYIWVLTWSAKTAVPIRSHAVIANLVLCFGYCTLTRLQLWNLNLCVQVGFAKDGKMSALDLQLYGNGGHTVDLSFAVSIAENCDLFLHALSQV